MVIDSLRTMVIWGFSLAVRWESFCWVEVIGFVILLSGTMIYNQVIRVPGLTYPEVNKEAALLDEEDALEEELFDSGASGYVQKGTGGAYRQMDADI